MVTGHCSDVFAFIRIMSSVLCRASRQSSKCLLICLEIAIPIVQALEGLLLDFALLEAHLAR